MRCICGYEYFQDRVKFGEEFSVEEGTYPFESVEVFIQSSPCYRDVEEDDDNTEVELYCSGASPTNRAFVCPKCGTVKFNLNK